MNRGILTDHSKLFYEAKSLSLELDSAEEMFEVCKDAFLEELSKANVKSGASLSSASNNLKNNLNAIFDESFKFIKLMLFKLLKICEEILNGSLSVHAGSLLEIE